MATLADQQTSTEMTIEFDPPALGSLIDERRAIRLSQSGHHRCCVMSLRRKPFHRRFAVSPNVFGRNSCSTNGREGKSERNGGDFLSPIRADSWLKLSFSF